MRPVVRMTGGLRPIALVAVGIGWVVYGRGIVLDPQYGTARRLVSITEYIPLSTLGWIWVGCGLVAVTAGLCRTYDRWQPAGFTALAVPAFLWGLGFVRAWADGGPPSASGAAGAWMGIAVLITVTAGLAEPAWAVEALGAKHSKRKRAGLWIRSQR